MFKSVKARVDIAWIGVSQIVSLTTSFILLYVLTHTLSVNVYGQYSLWFGIVIFLRQIFYDPLSYVLVKDCARLLKSLRLLHTELSLIRANFKRITFSLLGIAAVFLIVFFSTNTLDDINIFIILGLIFIALNATQGIFLALLNITNNRKAFSLFTIFDAVVKLTLIFLVQLLFEISLYNYIIAFCVAAFISCTAINIYLKKISLVPDNETTNLRCFIKQKFITALPLFLPTGLVALKGVLDKWMLAGYIGVVDLAVYSVLLQIGFSTMIISLGIVQTYVGPRIYLLCNSSSDSDVKQLNKFLKRVLLILFLLSAFAILLASTVADFVFFRFVGPAYRDFAYLLPWFVIAGGFTAAANILYLAVIGSFNSAKAASVTNVSVLFSVTIIVITVSSMGFFGSILGLVVSSFFNFLVYAAALSWPKFLNSGIK